jgi:hypothetical protein
MTFDSKLVIEKSVVPKFLCNRLTHEYAKNFHGIMAVSLSSCLLIITDCIHAVAGLLHAAEDSQQLQ